MHVATFHCPNAILDQWRGVGGREASKTEPQDMFYLSNDKRYVS